MPNGGPDAGLQRAEAAVHAARAIAKGQSLWRDAWRRLRRNRFAMGGLVVVVLMSLSAILAPVLIPYEPDYGQPWLRAQPPGFSHPAVLAENRFDVGEAPNIPKRIPKRITKILGSDGTLEFTALEIDQQEYRVKLRRGKVDKITQQEGARSVKRVEVTGEFQYVQVLDAERNAGPKIREVTLVRRKPLPEALKTNKRVLLLRVRRTRTPEPEKIEVTIEDGKVASIVRDGKSVGKLRIEGRYIHEVRKDGEVQRLRHLLGTDLAGQDVLSRVIYGGRISLMVGAVATLVSVLIGVVYGAIAGYLASNAMSIWGVVTAFAAMAGAAATFGYFEYLPVFHAVFGWMRVVGDFLYTLGLAGWLGFCVGWLFTRLGRLIPARALHRPLTTTGEFMMRIVDILYALPFMFLVILLMISYGKDIFTLFVALGAVQWLMMARIVRGQVLSLKEKEFIEAAHMSGTGHAGIIFRHLIPNTLGVVIVYATLTVPAVILQESFLAFIGLTVEYQGRTLDSWGSLVNQGRQALTSTGGNWWVLVYPSLAMAVTLFSLNFLGDGLRDALDPQMKGRT